MEEDQEIRYEPAGCATPRRKEYRIPVALVPPPPPKKKPFSSGKKKKKDQPKNGYFQPPDLELIFAMAPRRQACVLLRSELLFGG
ncbi:hypothetical protein CJ030_MR1G004460 [Morella rubra]|uniref:Cyclin-dependent protein kinase inhibitor SMR4 n=1 Tax=Morella rubra TaxID=262757 RepID=A0A6A1WT02_9ROSI|nr:hypothetical protein CJ030_MR1G004460 [Morella rubra]